MIKPIITPEIELALLKIAKKYYPHAHYEIVSRVTEEDCIYLHFQAYLVESTIEARRSHGSICDERVRFIDSDFKVMIDMGESYPLWMHGIWRGVVLTLMYSPSKKIAWVCEHKNILEDMNGVVEDISRPYPDGDKFEAIAKELYPILVKTHD